MQTTTKNVYFKICLQIEEIFQRNMVMFAINLEVKTRLHNKLILDN